jgi:hypothetical protein
MPNVMKTAAITPNRGRCLMTMTPRAPRIASFTQSRLALARRRDLLCAVGQQEVGGDNVRAVEDYQGAHTYQRYEAQPVLLS